MKKTKGAIPNARDLTALRASETALKRSAPTKVPVVAIGASAGGLEPIEQFFDAIKDRSTNAFVIIQHLSPNFESMMDELLSRHSRMEIKRVVEGMPLSANTIFLNPPRTEMLLENGCFKLREINDETHLNLPIDAFFTSIATEYEDEAIAIVMSGTGSDGTIGSGNIHSAGGTVIAQDPSNAKFDSMPASVIAKGYADAIGLPEEMADYVAKVRSGLSIVNIQSDEDGGDPTLRIFRSLRERFGTEFAYYKKATIERRLNRRAEMRGVGLADYSVLLKEDPEEIEALYADLLIEVTSFFRDREAYDVVRNHVIPELASKMSKKSPIRIWVPGCASGEEAYSLAILIADYVVANKLKLNLKILATDIHHRSLDAASKGIYPKDSVSRLSDQQIERYFEYDSAEDSYQIKQNLRRMVVFSSHNVLKDPPFTKMDMISCRNVLIYFNDVAQQKTLAFFHFALAANGVLFLGPSETTGKLQEEFSTIDQKWRVFQKKGDVRLAESVSFLPTNENAGAFFGASSHSNRIETKKPGSPTTGSTRQPHALALKELLRQYAPVGFLLNKEGKIVHVFGDAGEFLSVDSGEFSNKIVELVDHDLGLVISAGLERLKSNESAEFVRQAFVENVRGEKVNVAVKVRSLVGPGIGKDYILLTIEKIKKTKGQSLAEAPVLAMAEGEATGIMQVRIGELERDLLATEESLQSTIEELETSNEELQATNEELMASNEELQSTNEELHSVNEELYTVSSEHQSKIGELTELTDDMDHLLRATNIGIIFLDTNLNIRRFTPSATKTFNLLPQDAGRPFEHITAKFKSLDFVEMARQVIVSEIANEQEVDTGSAQFMMRILPYKTSLVSDIGAVVTMVDITELKAAQQAEIETTRLYGEIVSDFSEFLFRCDPKTHLITYCNQIFCDVVGLPMDEVIGQDHRELYPIDQRVEILQKVEKAGPGDVLEFDVIYFAGTPNRQVRSVHIREVKNEAGETTTYQATGRITTQTYKYRKALESLVSAGNIEDEDYQSALQEVLNIGSEHLGLPQAAIGQITGKKFRYLNTIGFEGVKYDDVTELDKLVCSRFAAKSNTLAIEHIGKSTFSKHKSYAASGAETFIGARLITGSGRYGALFFTGTTPRSQDYSKEEVVFIQLLASIVSHLIERDTRLQEIKRQRQHYQEIYFKSPVMMCIVDGAGKLVSVNDEWLSILEYKADDVIDKNVRDFMFPEDTVEIAELIGKHEASDDDLRKKPYRFRSKMGAAVSVELSAIQRAVENSDEYQYLIVLEDVTDRQTAHKEIERQKNELEEANEGLSRFAYIASHDLQEPLRKIRHFGELLQQDYRESLEGDGKYFVDVMRGSADRIRKLVEDLLAYSSTSAKSVRLKDIDLSTVLEDIQDELETPISESKAVIKVGKMPVVQGDETIVYQLLQNLVSNSIKYHKPDVAPDITVSARRRRDKTIIQVADKGIGMDLSSDRNIFDPFVRLERRGDFEGSGIGLAICKTVCDRLGWSIAVDSKVNEGTVISVTVPDQVRSLS